jgi:ribonuclease G
LNKKIVIARMHLFKKECFVMAVLEDDVIVEMQVHPVSSRSLLGNIYIGMVDRVLPEIKGAFVNIQPNFSCYYPLEEAEEGRKLKPGTEIVVQVCQEALKTKAPRVTSNLNLAGKYMVITAEKKGLGVSSKLDRDQRKNLKSWVQPFMRDDCGVIIRTNAAEASEEEILADLFYLYRRMDDIREKGKTRTCYSLIERALPFYLSILRDIRHEKLEKIVTDVPEIFEEIQEYCRKYQPEISERTVLYEDRMLPLYKLYSLERAFEEATKEKVWLKSGGFLVIQQTEAFVAVDVNTGKYAGKKKASETYRKINLEAANEVARQLRLRNLYGIILIDFINMDNPDDRDELLHVLASRLKEDPIRAQAVDMTRLQITEVTRKKMRKSLYEQLDELRYAREEGKDE